jgi:hypothetical protein
MLAVSTAAGLIFLILTGCFTVVAIISGKVDAYQELRGQDPPAP